ncbi:hypothetical protein B0H13DRAFT_1661185, partial [Mycena leptocephala]
LVCQRAYILPDSTFCGKACADVVERNGTTLVEVSPATFSSAVDFSIGELEARHQMPRVTKIYKVIAPDSSMKSYNAYRDRVEKAGQFKKQGKSPGNEKRRWHGTSRQCYLGDTGPRPKLCGSPTCAICSILKSSFDLAFFGKKTKWGRCAGFHGPSSGRSDDLTGHGRPSPWKAMLLNRVVVGNGIKLIKNNDKLTAPPLGHDSVLAEVAATGDLNYDEVVVYDNAAIRPAYVVMYELKP